MTSNDLPEEFPEKLKDRICGRIKMNDITNPRCPSCLSESRNTEVFEGTIHGLTGKIIRCLDCKAEVYGGQ